MFLVASLIAAAGCNSANRTDPAPAEESPRIVFGGSIGDVRLGMHRLTVERRYGEPDGVNVLQDYFPGGTRYHGKPLIRVFYRIHGGGASPRRTRGRPGKDSRDD